MLEGSLLGDEARSGARQVAWALTASFVLSGCTLSSGNEPRTYRGTTSRADLALRTAADDLGCPVSSLLIATTLEKRYSNTSTARYVIDGCGERALYVEQCEISDQPSGEGFMHVEGGSDSFRCRFLIVSRLTIPSRANGASPTNGPGAVPAAGPMRAPDAAAAPLPAPSSPRPNAPAASSVPTRSEPLPF